MITHWKRYMALSKKLNSVYRIGVMLIKLTKHSVILSATRWTLNSQIQNEDRTTTIVNDISLCIKHTGRRKYKYNGIKSVNMKVNGLNVYIQKEPKTVERDIPQGTEATR